MESSQGTFSKSIHGAVLMGRQLVSGSRRFPCVSIYPHSASNMSVNAVLGTMQCGYPRAAHVNITRGGASLNKIREKSCDFASASKVSFNFWDSTAACKASDLL
jgi:hypothetical protein